MADKRQHSFGSYESDGENSNSSNEARDSPSLFFDSKQLKNEPNPQDDMMS